MEPTELKIAPAQAGALCFRIKVHGQSAHACVREEGVSAIEKFMPIYAALTKLEKDRNSEVNDPLYSRYSLPIPLNLGKIQAGNWPSTVPESLVLEGRYGIGVGEDIEEARRVFEKTLSETVEADPWLREHRPDMEWLGGPVQAREHPRRRPHRAHSRRGIQRNNRLEGRLRGSDLRLGHEAPGQRRRDVHRPLRTRRRQDLPRARRVRLDRRPQNYGEHPHLDGTPILRSPIGSQV